MIANTKVQVRLKRVNGYDTFSHSLLPNRIGLLAIEENIDGFTGGQNGDTFHCFE